MLQHDLIEKKIEREKISLPLSTPLLSSLSTLTVLSLLLMLLLLCARECQRVVIKKTLWTSVKVETELCLSFDNEEGEAKKWQIRSRLKLDDEAEIGKVENCLLIFFFFGCDLFVFFEGRGKKTCIQVLYASLVWKSRKISKFI